MLLTQNFHVACNKATVAKRKSVFPCMLPVCLAPPPSSVSLALAPRKQLNAFLTFNMQATQSRRYLKPKPSCVPLATPQPASSLPAFPLPCLPHCCCIKITYFVGAACDVECCFVWSATCPLIVACKQISLYSPSLSFSISPCSLLALQIYNSAFFSLLLFLPLPFAPSLCLPLLHPLHSLLLKFAHFVLHMLLVYDFVLYPNKSVANMNINSPYNSQRSVIHCSLMGCLQMCVCVCV